VSDPVFWFMMQIAMVLGYVTSYRLTRGFWNPSSLAFRSRIPVAAPPGSRKDTEICVGASS
jgi:hypothetical protein